MQPSTATTTIRYDFGSLTPPQATAKVQKKEARWLLRDGVLTIVALDYAPKVGEVFAMWSPIGPVPVGTPPQATNPGIDARTKAMNLMKRARLATEAHKVRSQAEPVEKKRRAPSPVKEPKPYPKMIQRRGK